jgi:hypothetical protein
LPEISTRPFNRQRACCRTKMHPSPAMLTTMPKRAPPQASICQCQCTPHTTQPIAPMANCASSAGTCRSCHHPHSPLMCGWSDLETRAFVAHPDAYMSPPLLLRAYSKPGRHPGPVSSYAAVPDSMPPTWSINAKAYGYTAAHMYAGASRAAARAPLARPVHAENAPPQQPGHPTVLRKATTPSSTSSTRVAQPTY